MNPQENYPILTRVYIALKELQYNNADFVKIMRNHSADLLDEIKEIFYKLYDKETI